MLLLTARKVTFKNTWEKPDESMICKLIISVNGHLMDRRNRKKREREERRRRAERRRNKMYLSE